MVDNYGFGSTKYNPSPDLGHAPIWEYPVGYEDRQRGSVIDGFWVPGHAIQIVDGRKYIDIDAPETDREGKP